MFVLVDFFIPDNLPDTTPKEFMFPPGIKPQTFYWYSVEVLEEAKKYSIKYVGNKSTLEVFLNLVAVMILMSTRLPLEDVASL